MIYLNIHTSHVRWGQGQGALKTKAGHLNCDLALSFTATYHLPVSKMRERYSLNGRRFLDD